MPFDPSRTLADLRELRTLTGDAHGAQRVAFTPAWVAAREFLQSKLRGLPVETHRDRAGNFWATLPGASPKSILIGGHLDSVPNGGWLDGCLNVLAGVEVLRALAEAGTPAMTVRLVDWADEEGARFGRSLYGSSAVSGALDLAEARALRDKASVSLEEALRGVGIDLSRALEAKSELKDAAAYLELHIEQGPVLESLGLPMGAVLGTFGVERHAITFEGQAAHSGSTPMAHRRDALAGASRLHLAIREIAVRHGGVCTVGRVTTEPGIVTAVVGKAEMTLDQRHLDAAALAAMHAEARAAADGIAAEEKLTVAWRKIWQIQPFPFDEGLIALAEEAIRETCGTCHRLPSGPLHDAAEMRRTGLPTVMLFVQSLRGISHNAIEDTKVEHLEMSVRALHALTLKAMQRFRQGACERTT